jgi:hypothetical protein
MKLNRDDEYYKLIYNWVNDLDFIEGYEFLEAKSPNTDAFDHIHMEVKNVSGNITLRIDANGIMISCGCGCISSDEMEYFQVCEVQKSLDDLIKQEDKSAETSYWRNPFSDQNGSMDDLFKQFSNLSNSDLEQRIDRDLKRLNNNIDRVFERIDQLEMEKRESYLNKLKDVLGKQE